MISAGKIFDVSYALEAAREAARAFTHEIDELYDALKPAYTRTIKRALTDSQSSLDSFIFICVDGDMDCIARNKKRNMLWDLERRARLMADGPKKDKWCRKNSLHKQACSGADNYFKALKRAFDPMR